MRGVLALRQNGIPIHVIAVVTTTSLAYAAEIMSFFASEELLDIGFNIEEFEGAHRTSSLATEQAEKRYRAFLKEVLALSKQTPGLRIREFDQARYFIADPTGRVRAGEVASRNGQAIPMGIVTIDCDGNFSTFSPELIGQPNGTYRNFRFGNVHDVGFDAMLRDDAYQRVAAEISSGVDSCRNSCSYFEFCGGGAPANKLSELGSFRGTETMYCRLAVQAPFDLVLADFERSLDPHRGG